MNRQSVIVAEDWRYYDFRVTDARVSGTYEVYSTTTDLLFINQGDDECKVNGVILKPYTNPILVGSVFSVPAKEFEIYDGYLILLFTGIGIAPLVQIIQRFLKPKDR